MSREIHSLFSGFIHRLSKHSTKLKVLNYVRECDREVEGPADTDEGLRGGMKNDDDFTPF